MFFSSFQTCREFTLIEDSNFSGAVVLNLSNKSMGFAGLKLFLEYLFAFAYKSTNAVRLIFMDLPRVSPWQTIDFCQRILLVF